MGWEQEGGQGGGKWVDSKLILRAKKDGIRPKCDRRGGNDDPKYLEGQNLPESKRWQGHVGEGEGSIRSLVLDVLRLRHPCDSPPPAATWR